MAYRFLIDAPWYLNGTGPGLAEQREHRDLLVMGKDWIHPQFRIDFLPSAAGGHGYKEMAWGDGSSGLGRVGENYARSEAAHPTTSAPLHRTSSPLSIRA